MALSLISRSISTIHRLKNSFFDKKLSMYHIGCGQQFFLLHISIKPGISLQELACYGNYDKATATRAVQKLEKEGYVEAKMAESDKRMRHLYITEKAEPILQKTEEISEQWYQILTRDFTKEEIAQAEILTERMSANAIKYMEKIKGAD